MLDDRKMEVLRAIVSDYVSSREPVGSKALVERHSLGVSSATVRNDMAVLEDEGYITQPHTSAGRIPTDKGYRLFIDRLATMKPLSAPERRAIQTFLSGATDLDDVVTRTVRLLSQLTHQVAIVQYPVLSNTTIRQVELVSLTAERVLLIVVNSAGRVEQRSVELPAHDEAGLARLKARLNGAVAGKSATQAAADVALLGARAGEDAPGDRRDEGLTRTCVTALLEMLGTGTSTRVVVGGVPNLTRFGDEFELTVKPVLEALEEQVVLLTLLGEAANTDDVTVRIGRENAVSGLRTTSVITASYGSPDDVWAGLGIMGPTRMDYPATMASVRAIARYLGRFLNEG